MCFYPVMMTYMEFSHQLILDKIRETQGQRLTYEQIATMVGCSAQTVWRAVSRFEKAHPPVLRRLNRGQGKAGGSVYEVLR